MGSELEWEILMGLCSRPTPPPPGEPGASAQVQHPKARPPKLLVEGFPQADHHEIIPRFLFWVPGHSVSTFITAIVKLYF